ncbi:hypothetical protein BDW71DRAFT_68245 [Aspergillus fruticulosus]
MQSCSLVQSSALWNMLSQWLLIHMYMLIPLSGLVSIRRQGLNTICRNRSQPLLFHEHVND